MERRATPAPTCTKTASYSYCGSEAEPSAASADPSWVTLLAGEDTLGVVG
jgi:hypothetical protein